MRATAEIKLVAFVHVNTSIGVGLASALLCTLLFVYSVLKMARNSETRRKDTYSFSMKLLLLLPEQGSNQGG